jgi:hypothetical protein
MTLVVWLLLVILLNCVYSMVKKEDWSAFFMRTFLFVCGVVIVWVI